MRSRTGTFRWISGPFRKRAKAKLRDRRSMPAPYSAWVDVLEGRELLSASPSPTISFNLNAPTSLANQGIWVAMYGNVDSPVYNSANLVFQYAIEWDTNGNAQQVTPGSFVESTQLSFTPNGQGTSTATISIPDIPNGNGDLGIASNTYQLNGARLVFGIGHSPYLSVTSSGTVTAPAPSSLNDPNTAQNYDFVEFTLDQAGMHINTTTVDQFGFPITVSATPQTTVSKKATFPTTTLTVDSTAGFPSSGTIQVVNTSGQIQNLTYTGTTGTQFTGVSGGTGTVDSKTPVWSVSNYITASGVGIQLDRQDVFNGFASFVGSSSPFISSLTSGNTASAGSIYLPAPASGYLSAHTGSNPITVNVFNVSPDDPLLTVNFGSTKVTPTSATYNPVTKVTTITVTPPSLTNTTVDVTVTSTGGTSPTYAYQDYYVFGNGGTPTVTGLSAVTGRILGGNKVIINGTNFSDPNLVGANFQVLFGSQPAAFNVLSTTAILAYVPAAGAAGPVNVSVQINGQTASNTPTFTYVNLLPVVSGLSSSNAAPGSTITITGYNFVKNQTTVNFGKFAGTNVVVQNPNTLTVTVPAGQGGVGVTVTTPNGTSPATFDDRYIFPSVPTYSATSSLRLVNPSDILAIESTAPVTLYAKCEPGGNLNSGTTYYYVVTATSNTGESTALTTNAQSAQAGGIPGYKSIALAWTPFLNANGYNVYRSTSATGPFKFLAHVNGGPSSKFLDNGSATPTSQQPPSNMYTYDPLASYFDAELLKFFKHYAPVSAGGDGATFLLTYGGVNFTGTTMKDGAGRTYLNITGSDKTTTQIYQPLFNTNTSNPNYPPPQPGLANNSETPGQMVFSGDGVFKFGVGAHAADLGNVIVSAFNRGIATKFHIPPSSWGKMPSEYYKPGSTANWYAAYMHQSNVSISDDRPASLGGPQPLAYGFAYDDQAGDGGNGYGSYFTTPALPTPGSPVPNGSFGITINFGSWTPATKVSIVSEPKFDVNDRPLDFKVQLVDDNGKAVHQGGKEITLQVVGPFNLTTTYTLITAADGTATARSTSTGRPVEIGIPGDFTLKFTAPGMATQTRKLSVSLQSILLKQRLELLSLLQRA